MIISEDIFPDKATERRVLSMAIRCPNDGCEWTGELRNKEVKLTHISVNVNKQLYQHKSIFSSVEMSHRYSSSSYMTMGLIIFNFS